MKIPLLIQENKKIAYDFKIQVYFHSSLTLNNKTKITFSHIFGIAPRKNLFTAKISIFRLK